MQVRELVVTDEREGLEELVGLTIDRDELDLNLRRTVETVMLIPRNVIFL
ncbi:MAG: hypothetical protein UT94_C0045G0010 [Candidatus Uhrbacteria bacterium GW2011_GWF2_40_263]|nr:MAG: hypothetical protein UT94_C0045G0010 [Candidatus Uhrbacteria bacterium GW2011_GWF2_40_263]